MFIINSWTLVAAVFQQVFSSCSKPAVHSESLPKTKTKTKTKTCPLLCIIPFRLFGRRSLGLNAACETETSWNRNFTTNPQANFSRYRAGLRFRFYMFMLQKYDMTRPDCLDSQRQCVFTPVVRFIWCRPSEKKPIHCCISVLVRFMFTLTK